MSTELERARQELVTRLTWPYKIKSKLVADFERLVREDQDKISREDERPAPAAPLSTAWLIERGGLCLGICEYRLRWVTFTDESALRFSRRSDAYGLLETLKWAPFKLFDYLQGAFITEHGWWGGGESNAARAPAAPWDRGFDEATEIRRQLAKYELCKKLVVEQGGKEYLIDGSGCDSGDALDVTTAEIRQVINYLLDKHEAELANLTTHIAAQNEVLSALCAKAGVDFTDVEAAKKALDGRTAELEQVKAERDLANRHAADLFKRLQAAEAALGEKGQQ